MKKITKIASAILALCMCFGLFTACGNNGGKVLKIQIVNGGYGNEWLMKSAEAFEEKTGITVDVESIPRFASQSQAVSFLANPKAAKGVDLVFNIQSLLIEHVVGEKERITEGYDCALESLDDVYSAEVDGKTYKEKLIDGFAEGYAIKDENGDDHYYSVPWVSPDVGLVVNRTQYDKIVDHYPRTSDELIEICRTIREGGKTPFVFSSQTGYWTYALITWWAQYQGVEAFSDFNKGIDDNEYSTRIFRQQGRLKALETLEELISYDEASLGANDFIHENVNTLKFAQAQAKLMVGEGVMQPNGDWLENEMKKTAAGEELDDIDIIKFPVLSSIVETLDDKSMSDVTLRSCIDAVDNGQSAPAGVSESDFAKIKAARSVIYNTGKAHNAFIPAFAEEKQEAKDFLVFLASDEAMELFIKNTSGSSSPFKYDFDATQSGKDIYAGLSDFQKSHYKMLENASLIDFVTTKFNYIGGVSYFTVDTNPEICFTAQYAKDRKSAETIFNDDIGYWTDYRWNNVLTLLGLN